MNVEFLLNYLYCEFALSIGAMVFFLTWVFVVWAISRMVNKG